ncbi:MAG: succinyl-diaminopimelate desuccinylase [Hyphomicrobiales bacterium]|nr:succinyl-diaminopimelate desuccinylase [Hyphomicrobiales bacterium]
MTMLIGADPVALAQALVRCPSVTPDEGGALALLARELGATGFAVHRPVFSEPGTPDVENLYARFGTRSPVFVIAGHTDVVPPGDVARWGRNPFSGDIVDGVLHGRGACDMKGGLAAMTAAAIRFVRDNPDVPGSIALLVTGDEEGPAVNGTVKLLEWAHARGERFDHCLLGEPTNPERLGDMIKIGRRGSLTCRLTVTGKQGHVAYPEQTTNPIRAMVKLLTAVEAAPLDAGTAFFGPSTLEITTVDVGNPSSNVVPNEARATMNVRFNDSWTPETLEAELRRRFASVSVAGTYVAEFAKTNAVSFVTEPGPFVDMVSEAVKAETGLTPKLSTTGGTSDARFIKSYCPVVEFGTVGKTMHQVNESVATADIDRVCRITRRVLGAYFGRQ